MDEADPHDLMTIPETCQALRLCRRSLYNLLNAGTLHAVKIGRRTLIRREEVDRFLADLPAYNGKRAA